MGGFVGWIEPPPLARVDRVLALAGAPTRRASQVSLFGFGRRDLELAEDDEGGALAIAGYVRDADGALTAADVLARWRRRGAALLDDLHGEFSLAIYLPGEVLVARDRLGTRPLYVGAPIGGGPIFATSLRPLFAAGVPPEIDRDSVVRSLILGYVPAPRTAFARVEQLAPGELWSLAPRRSARRYFRSRERIDRQRPLDRAARALDGAITAAVRDAVPSNARIGAFLSGGIDSSLVLARLRELGHDADAFTLHFGDALPGELRYARAVAHHVGARHHVLELDARQFCDALEPALVQLEDLLSEPIAVPNFLLAREAARSCDVLFTGEGGDPPFGGPKNIGLVLAHSYRCHPNAPSLSDAYCAAHHHLYDDLDAALTADYRAAFDPARLADEVIRPWIDADAGAPGDTFVGRLMAANVALKGGSNILVKVAKMVAGAHDLALRSPLFDRRVIDLALTTPPWQKLDGTEEKLVLKRAAARSLPAAVVNRSKRGMAVPLSAWLDGPLGALAADVLTPRTVRERGLFRWRYVERLLRREPIATDLARSRSAEKLWLVLVTELHLRQLDRAHESGDLRRGP
ncbi:MAG TPA: asparagine synthase-related protein [Polyangia bacterium]|nr:asparagine synthase-related protein [Polyangia bacterium]